MYVFLGIKWNKKLRVFLLFSGYLLFKDFCENVADDPIPQIKFYEEVSLHGGFYIYVH